MNNNCIKPMLIGSAVVAVITMIAFQFYGSAALYAAIPAFLWMGLCLLIHGSLLFFLMNLFTKNGKSNQNNSNQDPIPVMEKIDRQ